MLKPDKMGNTHRDLREGVCKAYSKAAELPTGNHPFPVGRGFAESLGYPGTLLDSFPAEVAETFTGVSNVSIIAEIPEGATVLDIGCGAGLDCFVAASKAGASGKIFGIDFSSQMLAKAERARRETNLGNLSFFRAAAEMLPFAEGSIDVVLVNGIFNLNPARELIFSELFRVTKPGGVIFAAELILKHPIPPKPVCSLNDWFS